ncbi:MAG: type II secretion system protein GspI [Comamonadaceae bacterium]|nr:MAG: type II secretion system protein GspI [Comamonadaceae bacterium]
MSRRHQSRAVTLQRGFTLLEVLVALTIVAVALAACVRAAGLMATQNASLRDRALALISAQNVLAEIRVQRIFPAIGQSSTPCAQGTQRMVCERIVTATANRSFRQVTVRVLAQGDGAPLTALRGLASAWP